MKYIKTYKIFESTYSIDEFISAVSNGLQNYNITPVSIRTIIEQYSKKMETAVENGETPESFVSILVTDMDLEKNDFPLPSHLNTSSQQTIKYL